MLTLIHQIDAMLARVLATLQDDFIAEGGIKETMSRARRTARGY